MDSQPQGWPSDDSAFAEGHGVDAQSARVIVLCERAIVGNCADCGCVIVVANNRESWPLVECGCGWKGGVTEVKEPYLVSRIPRGCSR